MGRLSGGPLRLPPAGVYVSVESPPLVTSVAKVRACYRVIMLCHPRLCLVFTLTVGTVFVEEVSSHVGKVHIAKDSEWPPGPSSSLGELRVAFG